MLEFARAQVGKPFSNTGMARSIMFPRQSSYRSFFCAELVAAILKHGSLMSQDSNAGAATPYSLYKLYSKQAAATANPYTLRQAGAITLNGIAMSGHRGGFSAVPTAPPSRSTALTLGSHERRRTDSPPRASFRVIAPGAIQMGPPQLTLSLASLRG